MVDCPCGELYGCQLCLLADPRAGGGLTQPFIGDTVDDVGGYSPMCKGTSDGERAGDEDKREFHTADEDTDLGTVSGVRAGQERWLYTSSCWRKSGKTVYIYCDTGGEERTPMPFSLGVNMDPGPLPRGADAGAPDAMHPAQMDIEACFIDRGPMLVCYFVPEDVFVPAHPQRTWETPRYTPRGRGPFQHYEFARCTHSRGHAGADRDHSDLNRMTNTAAKLAIYSPQDASPNPGRIHFAP